MADSVSYEWSETKGAFAVSFNGDVVTYCATPEQAEEYADRLLGRAESGGQPRRRKAKPDDKEA